MDDWAWRKGRRYGTLLCDLERGCVVDLLPERSADSLAAWLRAHPGVEVISRDRAGMYAEGAKQGAPGAAQVADRFHLFRNLTDALERILQQGHARLRSAAVQAAREAEPQKAAEPRPTRSERQREANRARRLARYNEVVALKQRGLSNSAIARETGVERRTVIRWLKSDGFPERRPAPPRDRGIDAFLEHLRHRWEEGARNAALLFREIRGMGFQGKYSSVREVVQPWRSMAPPPLRSAGPRPLAAVRQSAWLLARKEEERTAEQRAYVQAVREQWPQVAELERLAREFIRLFRERDPGNLGAWLEEAQRTALRGFARGLFSDLEAVRNAMLLPWSNGPTEGHINRLKTLKRQMYGRAGFDLLRARMLAA